MSQLQDIYNFARISDWLSTAGQPKIEEFDLLKTEGFTKVINLALTTSTNALENEAEIVASLGLEYIHIPVIWENPTITDFQKFAQTLNQSLSGSNKERLFIHCAMNMRVSVFIYLYRRIYQSTSHFEASQDLDKIWHPNPIWHRFIESVIQYYRPNLSGIPPQIYRFEELALPTKGIQFEFQGLTYTRPYVLFNMVSSVDGKTTTDQGQMAGLGSRMDRKILKRLRSQVDAVVVGGGTFRADPFIPTVPSELLAERLEHFSSPQPLGIVITNSGNLPLDHRFWLAGKELRIVFLGAEASLEAEQKLADKAQIFRLSEATGNLGGMLSLLWQKFSVKSLMVEGGSGLNYEFIAAGWADELFLTLSPKLIGGVKNSTILGGSDYGMVNFPDLKLRSLYQYEDELYLRYQIRFSSSSNPN